MSCKCTSPRADTIWSMMFRARHVDLKDSLRTLAHTLKGSGKMYDYALVSTISEQTEKLLKGPKPIDQNGLKALNHQAQALYLIASKHISGDGAQAGALLLKGLNLAGV